MANCDTCPKGTVSNYVHESDMARMERNNKRLVILVVLLLLVCLVTNLAWVVYESQFETQRVEQEVDTGDGDAYVAGIGDVNLGESTADSNNP